MATETRIYDPDQIVCIFAGILIQGFAEDSIVKVEYDAEAFKKKTGLDGLTTRSKTRNAGAKITFTLMQGSPSNEQLSALHNLDLIAPGGAGVGEVQVKDLQGTSLHHAQTAWIEKFPDSEYGAEVGTREWVIDCGALDSTIGANLQAGVPL